MLKLELISEQPSKPGYGRLYLHGWAGRLMNVHMSVQRNQDRCYLADNGHWQVEQSVLRIPDLNMSVNGDHWLIVGPQLVFPLLSGQQLTYNITLSDGEHVESGELVMTTELARSLSGAGNIAQQPSVSSPEKSPIARKTESSGKIVETVTGSAIDKKRSLIWLWNLSLLVLIIGGISWLFSLWIGSQATDPAAVGEPSGPPLVDKTSCSTKAMASMNELDFIRACLDSAPGSSALLEIIAAAKTEKQCGVAQRLYAYKAQSGDAIIALAYAQEYDPQYAQAGSCFTPDVETAVYWYERVLNHDALNVQAKTRLAALKK